ncbi:2Fe-2S iron-sulfur cluster-binding protein [Pseudonocardia spinosispora]|uniref:2Fe-2S iron-sulfur cluster-binding protein n=1 Tax=Pseudonocardia spinosispora TaxID=103441 RepID=UPI0009FECD05
MTCQPPPRPGLPPSTWEATRRTVLKAMGTAAAAIGVAPMVTACSDHRTRAVATTVDLTLKINGTEHELTVEPRVTLLDALRERLGLTGTKKGCDRGECGACTVLADDRRIKSCLTLAVMQENTAITTVEGLASGPDLHPVQAAFIRRDAFQCGGCTPGQVVSAVACIEESHTGSADEIREWMSGNLCRCACYANIVAAVQDAAQEMRR